MWLTEDRAADDAPHLVALGDGLLACWRSGDQHFLMHLDAAGEPLGAPKPIEGAFPQGDEFFAYPNGDVGWVSARVTELTLYRYGGCTPP